MKALMTVFGCVLASALCVQAADGSGAYFKLDAGGVLLQDVKISEIDPGIGTRIPVSEVFGTSDVKFKFDPGARFDFAAGFRFNQQLALEVELGVLWNAVDKIKVGPTESELRGPFGESMDLNFWQIPILANLVYTIPLQSKLKPFFGGGVGGVASIFEGENIETESDFTFAYQGIAGINYAVNESMDFGVTYKFLGTLDHTYDTLKTEENYSHSILLNFNFNF